MEILYVTSSLPFGAGEAFVIPEISALRRRGHGVTIVPTVGRGAVVHEDAKALLPATVTHRLISPRIAAGALGRLVRSPRRSLRAALLLRGSRSPRILLKNLAVLPKGLWLAGEVDRRRIDHIHAHWGATSSTLALLASEVSGVPWSLTTHRWDIGENNLLDLKTRRASFVRAINRLGFEKIETLTRARPPKLLILHVGVDLPRETLHAGAANGRRVLVAASLREVKGHVYVLEAVELLKRRGAAVHLDCVGDGPLRSRLERVVDERGLDEQVTFAGALSHSELLEGLAAGRWSAVVLGSIVTPDGEHEGIPVSLLEAMSVGVPAIGAATGGIPDLLGDGAGILVPERDPAALADAIERVLDDADLRRELTSAGRSRVEARFDVEVVAAELERLFTEREHAAAHV